MNLLKFFLKGVAIGSGAILPGISSGVFCVIFGIYEKLLDSILNFSSDIKNNFKFLFPITIGIGNYCFYQFPIQTKSIFIGLILGSIPALIKEVNHKAKFKPFNLIFFFLALLIGISCIFLENSLEIPTIENINFFYLVLCGFCMSLRNCCSWC